MTGSPFKDFFSEGSVSTSVCGVSASRFLESNTDRETTPQTVAQCLINVRRLLQKLQCTEYSTVSVERTSSDWKRSTFFAQGMDTATMNAMVTYIDDSVKYINSMVIIRNGKLLYEKYNKIFDVDTTYHLFQQQKVL